MRAKMMVLMMFVLGTCVTGFGFDTSDLTSNSETKIENYQSVDVDNGIVLNDYAFNVDTTNSEMDGEAVNFLEANHVESFSYSPILKEAYLIPPLNYISDYPIYITNIDRGKINYTSNSGTNTIYSFYRNARDGLTQSKRII